MGSETQDTYHMWGLRPRTFNVGLEAHEPKETQITYQNSKRNLEQSTSEVGLQNKDFVLFKI